MRGITGDVDITHIIMVKSANNTLNEGLVFLRPFEWA